MATEPAPSDPLAAAQQEAPHEEHAPKNTAGAQDPPATTPDSLASSSVQASPPPSAASPQAPTSSPDLADLSAQLRQEAAEITEIAAQAGRLGIAIDAAKALREGTSPEALRSLVLERASAAADARDIVAAPPSPALPQAQESPIVAAAKRSASGAKG